MQAEGSRHHQTHHSLRSPLSAPEQNVKPAHSQRHVKWGANEGKRILGDHELDELAKDPSAFSTLRRSLLRHKDSLGRESEASPSNSLGVYVDPNEVDGLPVLVNQEKAVKERSSNTTGQPSFSRVFDSWRGRETTADKTMENEEEGGRKKKSAIEKGHPFTGNGSGILSALLGIHDRQSRRSSEASSAELTEAEMSSKRTTKAPLERPAPARTHRFNRDLGIKGVFDMINNNEIVDKTRSDAGVFGPLIAATGNLTGIASPSQAEVAPDPTQPGHRISRYSYADDGPTPRSTPNSRPPSVIMESANSTPVEERSATRNPTSPLKEKGFTVKRTGWSSALKALTPAGSHDSPYTSDTEGDATNEKKRRRRKTKRKREDIFITMHVAHIIYRQDFILKMTRAFLMFGAPSHRLEAQLQTTGKILGLNVSCMYLPTIMLISFNDTTTGTSNIKFVKQASSLNLGKLIDAYALYWSVIHDEISVSDASNDLDQLMLRAPLYNGWACIIIGGFCSSFICPISYHGSFLDALMCFPLSALLVFVQTLSAKNELYSNVFEIVIATLMSFIAGGLAETGLFCYSAIASASIVLILPGYIILCGSLEIASRNIASGAVRMCYAVIYSLFLGFGLAMGAEVYHQVSGSTVSGNNDYNCVASHLSTNPWWRRTPSPYWAFLCTPMCALFVALKNQSPWWRKELYISTLIACGGWAANHFASQRFVNRNDISSAIGAFVVGLAGNIYGRFSQGNAFVAMVTGVMFLVPSGLSNGGLLAFASQSTQGSPETYASGFQVAEQLVSVAIGLTVGLFMAAVVVHPFASKRRGTALFSL